MQTLRVKLNTENLIETFKFNQLKSIQFNVLHVAHETVFSPDLSVHLVITPIYKKKNELLEIVCFKIVFNAN